ncbi:DUF4298 domain-containing protein [Dentiradicibacter hellwigii]|uniref:DUF4298 domain-containing protein n=1 Tax=Dentiradicibacter hellwigii TaxID=3149053 RepID=A0ABV4UFR2_9RHOO
MNSEPTLAEAQTRIDEIQQLYREWMQWQPKLQAAQSDWQHAAAIMQKLAQFYFGGEYNRYYNALANGLDVDLRTQGEYSVMSEDALWNAFGEQQTLAWQWLRAAVAALDPEAQPAPEARNQE